MRFMMAMLIAASVLLPAIGANAIDPVSVVADSVAVRLGQSTTVRLLPLDQLDPGWTYEWSVERGDIVGAGATATYSAPVSLEPGYDMVNVNIMQGATVVSTLHAALFAYKQFIILKADDMVCYDTLPANFVYYLDYVVNQRQLKTSIGLITEFIDPSFNHYLAYADFIQFLKDYNTGGHVEILNYGYDHLSGPGWYEFQGTNYDYQKYHLETGETLARSVLGFPFTTFAPSFNLTDATTVQVVNESADIQQCLFAPAGSTKPMIPRGGGEIEAGTGNPSYSGFLSTYLTTPNVVVLQHHPNAQTFRDTFDQFVQIIDYLVAAKVTFVKPAEYFQMINSGTFPPGWPINPADVHVTASSVMARPLDAITVTATPQAGLSPLWTYEWTATQGTITGSDSSVTYTAPATIVPGYAVITVTIRQNGILLVQRSVAIYLFNQFIILRANDWERAYWQPNGIGTRWPTYVNYVTGKEIKTSIGVITRGLDAAYPPPPGSPGARLTEFVDYTKAVNDTGFFEFWNNGYDHLSGAGWQEFFTTDYSYQKAHLETGQTLANSLLGFPFTAFGTPGNTYDATTITVVNESTDLKVWLYGPASDKLALANTTTAIETSTGVPDYANFVSTYTATPEYLALQLHPNFDTFVAAFAQFGQIVDLLLAQNDTFVKPTEYYSLKHDGVFILNQGDDTDADSIPDTVEGTGDSDGNGIPNFLDPDVAPAITTQPTGGTIDVGQPFTFTVVASGTAPLYYMWYVGGVPIADATSSSYAIASALESNSGSYTVAVSNRAGDYLGNATSTPAVLTVSAVDIIKPVITLLGSTPVYVPVGGSYSDDGATALDNLDGNITSSIVPTSTVNTAVLGAYTVTYNVSDAAGNPADPVVRTVYVVDLIKPVITRLGLASVTIMAGATYTDAGATAFDNYDGNITGLIVPTSTVNTAVAGNYTVTYNVSDSSGNPADPVVREVRVLAQFAVTSPSGGESWYPGSPHTITWTGDSYFANVKITLRKGGVLYQTLIASTPNTGSYSWALSPLLPVGSDYQIRIIAASDPTVQNTGGLFSIVAAPLIQVTSPNGGEAWYPSSTHDITWTAEPPITNVKITLLSGGVAYETLVASTANTGSYSWAVPADLPLGTDYTVQVESATDSFLIDASDASFSIVAEAPIRVTSPNGGESWYLGQPRTLTWASQPAVTLVTINLLRSDAPYRTLATSIANTGAFAWTVPADLPLAADYKIEVVSATDPLTKDSSDAAFSIVAAPTITVSVPKGTSAWIPGTAHTITYTAGPNITQVRITLRKGNVLYSTIKSPANNTGSFLWTIPANLPPGNDYQVRVLAISDLNIRGTSELFNIVASPIHIISPNGGELWQQGTTHTITWSTDISIPSVKIIVRKNGAGLITLATAAPNTGSFDWAIPADQSLGVKYEVRIISTVDGTIMKTSDNYFSIVAP